MDDRGRPRVLLLSAGNTNDITMAHALIKAAGKFQKLLADRGYDADHLRTRLAERRAEAVIPTPTSRKRRRTDCASGHVFPPAKGTTFTGPWDVAPNRRRASRTPAQ